jgi:hypothetical protein
MERILHESEVSGMLREPVTAEQQAAEILQA